MAVIVTLVGGGPRSTGILERIVALAGAADTAANADTAGAADAAGTGDPIDVHVVDPFPPGGGRIWRQDQPALLWMNSTTADVAMYPDGTGGPTLADWLTAEAETLRADPAVRPELDRLLARPSTAFASRSVHSRYLAAVFESLTKAAPDRVRVHVHRASATDLTSRDAGGFTVHLSDGADVDSDRVVLALGHPENHPSAREAALAEDAVARGSIYVGPGYTADLDTELVPAGEPVLVSGLGLAFVDWTVLLAESRGGRFDRGDDGILRYRPSGREPLVYAGSRRGVPYHAKISYSIADAAPPLPHLLRADAFPDRTLDFRADVLPVVARELARAHYHELWRSHPDRVRGPFAPLDDALAAGDDARVATLVASSIQDPADRFDLDLLDRPLAGETFPSRSAAAERVHEYIDADLRRRADPAYSADAAVFTALLSIHRVIGDLVRLGRLTPADIAAEVEGTLHSLFSFVASGPPPERLEQILALGRAGVIRFLGPDTRFSTDDDGYVATSPSHPDVVRARAFVEARLPVASVSDTADDLLATLFRRGRVAEVRSAATGPGKVAVDDRSRVVDATGAATDGLYAVGPFVAGHTWSGAFPRPNVDAGFFRHNEAVARDLLTDVTSTR